MFPSQVNTSTTTTTLFFLISTVAALLATAGLAFVDAGLSRPRNVLDAWLGKLAAGAATAFGFSFVGYGVWQWQFNSAFGVPNPLGQGIKDWWLGGGALTTLPQALDPKLVPTANEQQIFFGFFITFAFFLGAFLHSGSIGRLRPIALIATCLTVGGVLYPLLAFLTWGPVGPLTNHGLHDFEGVFMVYIFGGSFALAMALRSGPRRGAFSNGVEGAPANLPQVAAGVLLLMIGLPLIAVGSGYIVPGYGFFGISMTSSSISDVANGVLLAFMSGAVGGLLLTWLDRRYGDEKGSSAWLLFGPIAAFVANGTLFDVVTLWKIMAVGFAAPFVTFGTSKLMKRLKIDELKVVPLALAPGIFGVLVGGLIAAHVPTGGYFGLKGEYGFQHAHIDLGHQALGIGVAVAGGLVTATVAIFFRTVLPGARDFSAFDLDNKHWGVPALPPPVTAWVPEHPAGPAAMMGKSVPIRHHARLLRGDGRYVDDIDQTGMFHAAIIRSPHAHARVTRFDARAAYDAGEAILVLGPDELERITSPLPVTWKISGQRLDDVAVVSRTARFVGQPLGIVVARSRAEAEDALERVEIEYEVLAPVIGVEAAVAPGAPLLYPEFETNVCGETTFGDTPENLDKALTDAPHMIERTLDIQRVAYNSMEPRGLIADWIPGVERLEVHSSTQVPHLVREEIAALLSVRMDQVRVVAPDVGGAFGGKTSLNIDEAMVCAASKVLGHKVKWIEDRTEALTASYQGRGQRARARLGVDENGRFLAFSVELLGDLGAFATTAGTGPFQVSGLTIEGPYRFEHAGSQVKCVFTNCVPTGAYRGYGMQESAWIRERMIEEAAREIGMDPVELRRRNLLTPKEMPYTTNTMLTYDSGDYRGAFDRAVALVHDAPRSTEGRIRRGFAITANTEVTGFAPTALLELFDIHWAGWEAARIRVNPDGTVTVFAGVTSMGQGIETTLAQIAADHLNVPLDLIHVELGDTATATYSNFSSQASRSLTLAGAALIKASDKLRGRILALAGAALGTDPRAVEQDGLVFRAGANQITWREVAHRGWMGWGRDDPDHIQLEETADFDPPGITFSFAAQAANVSVDLDLGKVRVEDYWSVNDSGVLVNPMIAEGQIVGGVVQGLGIALLEEALYDPASGQPRNLTYLDYAVPLADDVPDVKVEHMSTPSPLIPGGFKGLGEGGIMPPAATVGNALANAVPEIAQQVVATPLTPGRVWTLLDTVDLTTPSETSGAPTPAPVKANA